MLAALAYLPFATEPIAIFHLVFVLLTGVALLRTFRHFVARVLPVMAATATILVVQWNDGDLPGADQW